VSSTELRWCRKREATDLLPSIGGLSHALYNRYQRSDSPDHSVFSNNRDKGVASLRITIAKGDKMTVLVRTTAAGLDHSTYDQMAPGLHPLLKQQPGFIMHVAYPIPGGFAIGEIWESQAQHESWYNEFVAPNLPDPDAMSTEYHELHAIVQP
jgi:hypothetical protein